MAFHAEVKPGLDRDSDMPLFLQIRQRLLTEIIDGASAGHRLPSELQLAKRFNVSKMTIRQALQGLVDRGVLTRGRGRGTAVTGARVIERLTPALDIDEQHRAAGLLVETVVLSVCTRAPESVEADILGLAAPEDVMEIKRLRNIAGVPSALDVRVLPDALGKRCGFNTETAAESIIDRLRDHTAVSQANWQMSAHLPDVATASYLHIERAEPVLTRRLRYVDGDGGTVMIGSTVHRSDRLACEVTIDLDDRPR